MSKGNIKKFKKKGYESLNRNMLQDVENLSLQAIGLLANLTSMPDEWKIYKTELYKRFAKNGRRSVQNAWDELVENNYIVQLRKRNGKKYEYVYYHSQDGFTEDDIKEIEEAECCNVWDGKKLSSKKPEKPQNGSVSSNVQNVHPKNNDLSNVRFEQFKMDSSKRTYNRFTNDEVYYQNKDLDTIDTKDTKNDDSLSDEFSRSLTDEKRKRLKENYMENAFFENNDHVPTNIAKMLKVFTSTQEEALEYYNLILLAKKNAENDADEILWLEHEPELEHEIINTFSRSIRKIEKERNVKNTKGYIYQGIYDVIMKKLSQRRRFNVEPHFNWLER